jgi:glycosyltransferase involved in cell wall biosynthesis
MGERVLVVSGSYPPDVCGVGDYVQCLNNAFNANDWDVYVRRDWSLNKLFLYVKEIEAISPDKLIIQYPTQGYGWSLAPFILMIYFSKKMGMKCIVTYHEFSNQSFKARLCENLALYGVRNLVVTNEYEKKCIEHYHKKLKISVIKIFSNIPKASKLNNWEDRNVDYCYFGQIRPNKGIEEYISAIGKSKKHRMLIGTIPKGFEAYGEKIVKSARERGIDTVNNATYNEVADYLNMCKMAILPFPDGLSERRGSFLAAAINGCLISSTIGKYTSDNLKKCIAVEYVSDIKEIDSYIDSIGEKEWELQYRITNDYLGETMPHSWEDVVGKYNEL